MIPATKENYEIFKKKVEILNTFMSKTEISRVLWMSFEQSIRQALNWKLSNLTYLRYNTMLDECSERIQGMCEEVKYIKKYY